MLFVSIFESRRSIEMANKEKAQETVRPWCSSHIFERRGERNSRQQRESKSEIYAGRLLLFSLLYARCIIVIKICFVFIHTHTHYFSDSAARQEQEAALRSGASCGPRQERRCASGLMPPPALQQHKGPDPGTQKINVTQ